MKKVLFLLSVIHLIGCNSKLANDSLKSKLTKNPFTICYTCTNMYEADSFEQRRGATYLNIDRKNDIMMFYEFGFADDQLMDTLSNKQWMEICMYSNPEFQCDTLRDRKQISDSYRFYFFRDSMSGLEQMTLYISPNDHPTGECNALIYSRVYLYNKIFSPYTHSNFPRLTDSYFSDINYLRDDFNHQFITM